MAVETVPQNYINITGVPNGPKPKSGITHYVARILLGTRAGGWNVGTDPEDIAESVVAALSSRIDLIRGSEIRLESDPSRAVTAAFPPNLAFPQRPLTEARLEEVRQTVRTAFPEIQFI
jgi:hypothetical protein